MDFAVFGPKRAMHSNAAKLVSSTAVRVMHSKTTSQMLFLMQMTVSTFVDHVPWGWKNRPL